ERASAIGPLASGARATRESFWVRRRALAAAILTGLVIAGGALLWESERYPSYATEIGERRSFELSDGSTVDLNARSKLRVEFSGAERRVELLEGQALFQVAKDKARPFIVKSADATVRAVGTQFDVDRKSTGTTVTVLEGRVVVYPGAPALGDLVGSATTKDTDGSANLAVPVTAGQQVTVTKQVLRAAEHADVAAATAWKQRKLIFDGTRLADVVEAFNRNNRRQFVIESGALADYHLSGVYSSIDPSALIQFLREQPGFKITETDSEVRIASE